MKDVRKKVFEKEITETLKEFIKQDHQPKVHWFTGTIEDNVDPKKNGRCRIRVYGVFSDLNIPTDALPWAKKDESFVGSSVGSFVVPPIGTIVKVYFENDDVYNPIYTTKALVTSTLSSERDEDYPNSMVLFETDAGEFFKINRTTNESVYRHASGTLIKINEEGDISIDNSGTSSGKVNFISKGDISLVSETGSVKIEAELGFIDLGSGAAVSVNNIPLDQVTGAPNTIGQQFPGTPGSTRVRA